ncbi:MAG: BrnT family toxin [Myxococcota bacterium]|nr:BrnT family toxin [Myxococcota bacterium]
MCALAFSRRHGVSFEEAQAVFFEDSAIIFDDPDHSWEEQRFLLLGASDARRILIVAHCYREEEEVVRIISAREATRRG